MERRRKRETSSRRETTNTSSLCICAYNVAPLSVRIQLTLYRCLALSSRCKSLQESWYRSSMPWNGFIALNKRECIGDHGGNGYSVASGDCLSVRSRNQNQNAIEDHQPSIQVYVEGSVCRVPRFSLAFLLLNALSSAHILPAVGNRHTHPSFPKVRPHAPNTMQTPPRTNLSFFGKVGQMLWSVGNRLQQRDAKYAIKAGMATALLAAPAFFDATRTLFVDWWGDWALISVGCDLTYIDPLTMLFILHSSSWYFRQRSAQ